MWLPADVWEPLHLSVRRTGVGLLGRPGSPILNEELPADFCPLQLCEGLGLPCPLSALCVCPVFTVCHRHGPSQLCLSHCRMFSPGSSLLSGPITPPRGARCTCPRAVLGIRTQSFSVTPSLGPVLRACCPQTGWGMSDFYSTFHVVVTRPGQSPTFCALFSCAPPSFRFPDHPGELSVPSASVSLPGDALFQVPGSPQGSNHG